MVDTHTENSALETWSTARCPFPIEYSRRVLDDIRLAVVDAFFSLPRGGAEIGGVLLGKFDGGRLAILDYRPLDCEHALGPSFALSLQDQARLEELLERCRKDEANLQPVGWYHSHTRSEIFLSDADLEVHNRYFPEPWQVALVLRPSTMDPTRAGFFFREPDGSISSKASYQEFALDALPAIPVPFPASNYAVQPAFPPPVAAEPSIPQASSFAPNGAGTHQPAEGPAAQTAFPDPQVLADERPATVESLPQLAKAIAVAGTVESIQSAPPPPPAFVPPTPEPIAVAEEEPLAPGLPESGFHQQEVPSFAQEEPRPMRRRLAVAALLAAAIAASAMAYQHRTSWLPRAHAPAATARPRPTPPATQPAPRPTSPSAPVEATKSFQAPVPAPPAPDTKGLQQAAAELEKKSAALAKQNDEIAQQNTDLRKENDELTKQVARLKADLAAASERPRKVEDQAEQSRKQQQRKRLENQSFFDPLQ